jgi:Fic family protein
MMTFRQFAKSSPAAPMSATWYLADLSESLGKQELFTRQSPQRLKALREHALIESAVSSNRIEGVEADQRRIATVVFGRSRLKDRDEEEIRGYRDALNLIHTKGAKLPVSEKTIQQLHKLSRGEIWDAGKYKEKDGDIIQTYADGRSRVRFRPTSAKETPAAMRELIEHWDECKEERLLHPIMAVAAFNLDFLCIHPFRDGNGRASRLLLLLQCYYAGMEVGRYISLERVIEENKERYYEVLEKSSQGWHQGKHDPWPFINFVLFILKTAYSEFESRFDKVKSPRGEKTELVLDAVNAFESHFTLAQLERTCPGVSRDMMRLILRRLADQGEIRCVGRGPGSVWEKTGKEGNVSKEGNKEGNKK